MTQAIKRCSRCEVPDLPITDFNKSIDAADGLQSICRNCHIEYKSEYEKKHISIAAQRLSTTKWNHSNKIKRKAHRLVKQAIKSGDLIRCPCEVCNAVKTEAHHEDYSKPLEVNWLCRNHHRARHMEINEYFENNPQLILI